MRSSAGSLVIRSTFARLSLIVGVGKAMGGMAKVTRGKVGGLELPPEHLHGGWGGLT
jgi:hypothetical protein